MNHDEILETLSDTINILDAAGKIGAGDKLFEIITELKKEWKIEE